MINSAVKHDFFKNFCFYILILIAPFVYYIRYTSYGFFYLEIGYFFIFLVMVALFLTGLEKVLGWLGYLLISTFIIVFCFSFLPNFKTNNIIYAMFFIILLLNIFLETHIRTIFSVMALVFIISTLILPIKHQPISYQERHFQVKQPINNTLPPIIHLVLDEHAGIDGIPMTIADGKELRKQLENFYIKNGFHVYASAYSHYVQTFDSVSNLVNFSKKSKSLYYFNHSFQLTDNAYFKLMARKGYRIRVYQFNTMIDYCETNKYPIESCYEYPATNLNSIKHLGILTRHKFLFILKSYLLFSHVFLMIETSYQYSLAPALHYFNVNIPPWGWYQARTSAILIPAVFRQIAHDIKQNPYGTFFYAHILGPHNPYVYDENCQLIKNPMSWQINISADPVLNTQETRIARYALYENQVRCVTKQVNSLLDVLKKEGIYNNTIIIINGDHGSRITKNLPYEYLKNQFTLESYHDCFNTFFAVKIPTLSSTVSFEILPIQTILANVVSQITGISIPVENTRPFVYMLTRNKQKKMIPLFYDSIKSKPKT